jgi:hypothetical protein
VRRKEDQLQALQDPHNAIDRAWIAGVEDRVAGRDIEEGTPTEVVPQEQELTVRAIVLQQLYGLNVPAKVTNAIPLDSGATTAVSKRQCPLPEEVDTVAVAVEEEAQHLLLLLPQSLQEPVQS